MITDDTTGIPEYQPSQLAEYRRKLEAGEVERSALKTPWEKLREHPTDRRRIVAFCNHCMGWEEGEPMPSGVRADIKAFPSPRCPFFDVRPYR